MLIPATNLYHWDDMQPVTTCKLIVGGNRAEITCQSPGLSDRAWLEQLDNILQTIPATLLPVDRNLETTPAFNVSGPSQPCSPVDTANIRHARLPPQPLARSGEEKLGALEATSTVMENRGESVGGFKTVLLAVALWERVLKGNHVKGKVVDGDLTCENVAPLERRVIAEIAPLRPSRVRLLKARTALPTSEIRIDFPATSRAFSSSKRRNFVLSFLPIMRRSNSVTCHPYIQFSTKQIIPMC